MLFESDMTLVDPRDKKTYYLQETFTRRILTTVIKFVFSGMGIIKVSGLENLPSSGPVILAANHMTNFDVFPMQFAINRSIYYMGKAELFQNPLLDALLRRLGGFPVYRGRVTIGLCCIQNGCWKQVRCWGFFRKDRAIAGRVCAQEKAARQGWLWRQAHRLFLWA
jgi:1-acyl-sn-glycerol-3-phosphate acyltransferase